MSKVRFCIEEDNLYSLERLEKVLGRDFWYRDKNLRDTLKEFIKFPDSENLIELLKFTPHAPVYDKEKLKSFKPNVLLITNEPGLNCDVLRSLYLRPAREVVEALCEHSGCIFGARTVLEEIIERFNRSMFSWLTLTPLCELGDKINGDSVKPIRNDCGVLQNITSHNDQDDLKKIAYCLKKISYWIPTHESILEQLKEKRESLSQLSQQQLSLPQDLLSKLNSLIENLQRLQQQQQQSLLQSIEGLLELLQQQPSQSEESQRSRRLTREMQQLKQLLQQLKHIFMVKMWLDFIKQEEPRVIHWDLLPYAQYGEEKNDINDEIREIIEEVEQKNFQNIRNEIISKASYKQSLWYVKLLDKFLEAFEEVNIEEGNFFILVVGNRIIRGRDKDRKEILGHLFAGLYEHNKDIKKATVIFRDNWCSCQYSGQLYFFKFSDFLNQQGQNFEWQTFNSKLNGLRGTSSTYYGGKNQIPCY